MLFLVSLIVRNVRKKHGHPTNTVISFSRVAPNLCSILILYSLFGYRHSFSLEEVLFSRHVTSKNTSSNRKVNSATVFSGNETNDSQILDVTFASLNYKKINIFPVKF